MNKIVILPARRGVDDIGAVDFVKESCAAYRLGLFVDELQRIRRRGELPFYKIGKTIVYKWSEIEMFMKNRRVEAVK